VLVPTEEAAWVSTNDVAQYGLSTIQGIALAGEGLGEYARRKFKS
jgi:YetA-like protein